MGDTFGKFTFEPGYYEWHLKRNGKLFFVFGDEISEQVADKEEETGHDIDLNGLREIVEGKVDDILYVMNDVEVYWELPEEVIHTWEELEMPTAVERKQIENVMVDGYARHFGLTA